ncbi:MAG TPA: hypothetical protein VFB62_05275 [Polyangiaceae bacterium]|nr:hypothetical protein [Polyangiaceae bacterium]
MRASLVLLLLLLGSMAHAEDMGPQVLHMPHHERRADRGILRPVPIDVELPPGMEVRARRVLVHYRLWGMPDWTTLELRRQGARFTGAIPCLEVSTVTGNLKYYIRVHDAEGRVIATGASRAKPYLVVIRHDTTLGKKERRVARCPDPADCPRGLLGCPSERVVEIQCHSDSDCEGGMTCSWRGFCERAERYRYWVLASVEQDIGIVERTGACSLYAQENEGYGCYRQRDGLQYTGHPVLTNEPLAVGLGPTRVMLGFDYLVYYDLTVGIRTGWIVRGEAPTPSEGTALVPFSAALRVAYWFGDDPFNKSIFRPNVFLTGGYAMFDIASDIHVREDPSAPPRQGGNDLEQELDLYKRAGDAFIGVGAGLSIAASRWAPFLEVGLLYAFPFGAFVIAPNAGLAVGF